MQRTACSAGKRLVSLAVALVLAVSMIPAAAFADEGDVQTLSLDVSTQANESEVPNINVDVPATIVLNNDEATDPKGINIKNLGTVSGKEKFTNNSNNAVRIKEIKYSASDLNKYFTIGSGTQATFTLGDTADAKWTPDSSTTASAYTVEQSDAPSFTVGTGTAAKPSDGYVLDKGASIDGTLTLSFAEGSAPTSDAKTAAKTPTTDNPLMKCTWVFESVRGMGQTEAENANVDFYLTDKRDPDHPVTYSLNEVKEDAEKLPSQSAGAWPYDMYYDFVTGTGDNYECKVRWSNTLYPLRIIGLNQDEKTSGGMAGLTFMFRQSPETRAGINTGDSNSWTSNNVGRYMRSGGGLAASVKNVIPSVKKVTMWMDGSGTTRADERTNDKAFILSLQEVSKTALMGDPQNTARGVGQNKDEMYKYFEVRMQEFGTENTFRLALGLSNALLRNAYNANAIRYVNDQGATNGLTPVDIGQKLFPCFCL